MKWQVLKISYFAEQYLYLYILVQKTVWYNYYSSNTDTPMGQASHMQTCQQSNTIKRRGVSQAQLLKNNLKPDIFVPYKDTVLKTPLLPYHTRYKKRAINQSTIHSSFIHCAIHHYFWVFQNRKNVCMSKCPYPSFRTEKIVAPNYFFLSRKKVSFFSGSLIGGIK